MPEIKKTDEPKSRTSQPAGHKQHPPKSPKLGDEYPHKVKDDDTEDDDTGHDEQVELEGESKPKVVEEAPTPKVQQTYSAPKKSFSGCKGVVAAINGKEVKVVSDEHGLQTYRVAKNCKVVIDGKKGYLSDLDNGWEVSLGGTKQDEITTINATSKK